MRDVKRLLKALIKPFASAGSIDVRSCRWRLDALGAAHAELSGVASLHDSPGQPSARLLDLVPPLFAHARAATLPRLEERNAPALVQQWPGEHYKLIVALMEEVKPKLVVEIGTYTGLSALAFLRSPGRLVTFDVVPWKRFPGTYLREQDFAAGRFEQIVADLGDPSAADRYAALLREADLVFVDAAKDGVLERRILANFERVKLRPGTLVLFDDIRVWNMLDIWRGIAHPKIDLTSLGHYSGTGLVDWASTSR